MLLGFNGGRLGKNNDPLPDSAIGVWTGNEQALAKRLGVWPTFSTIPTTGLQLALDASLPASYPGSGTTWFDFSGNGYNGNINNATYLPDFGGYIYFNGLGDNYVSFSNYTQPEYTPTNSFTWSVFARVFETPSNDVLLGNRNPAPFVKLTPSGLEYSGANLPHTMPYDQWIHVCIVKNGFDFTYYQDTVTITTAFNNYHTNSGGIPFYVGGDPSYGEMLTCNVGQVLVYNVALGLADITQIFDASKTRFGI
jgi:hypothetical protein